MANWGVDSIHINVQGGDSAVHLKVTYGTDINVCTIQNAVLVDAGKGGNRDMPALRDTLWNQIPNFYVINNHQANDPVKLDAVVITHWDSDHYKGLWNLLNEDLTRYNPAVNPPDNWKPAIFKYDPAQQGRSPLTTLYCPNWAAQTLVPEGTSGKVKAHYFNFTKTTDANNQEYLSFKIGNTTYPLVAKLQYENLIGMEFFRGLSCKFATLHAPLKRLKLGKKRF
jgi:ribonuclease BN (tRNA processing enzyme)